MAYVRAGCTGDVWTTCNGSDQVERVKAQARSQVYMAGNAWRNIWVARQDSGTGDRVVCLGARPSELEITCTIRAAWAGLSGVRQEHRQASCHDPEGFLYT